MAKISRNAPCPCGSGIKYKKCCLPKHKAEKATASPEVVSMPPTPPPAPAGTPLVGWVMEDDLDELSNSVIDLIKEGRLDKAEAVCQELLERYPEVPDGLERLAAVKEARGDFQKAADLYRQAAAFIHGEDGFDPRTERFYLEHAADLERKAKA